LIKVLFITTFRRKRKMSSVFFFILKTIVKRLIICSKKLKVIEKILSNICTNHDFYRNKKTGCQNTVFLFAKLSLKKNWISMLKTRRIKTPKFKFGKSMRIEERMKFKNVWDHWFTWSMDCSELKCSCVFFRNGCICERSAKSHDE